MLRFLAARRWIAMLLAGVTAAAGVAVAQEATPVVRFEVERFVVEGDHPLSEAQTRSVLDPFTGEHAGVDGLLAAADALEQAIRDAGTAFQRVVLPPQSLQDGEVVLRVAVFRVTGVEVRSAQHHSEANVRRSVPALREGETPDTGAIARDLAVANRQPWKTTTLTFRESGTEAEGLDAALEVEDRAPRLVWSGLNNTGSASTGPWRWSLGGSLGNLFDRDHTLDASFTTTPGHAGRMRQWGVGYGLPVYGLGGALSGYFVRSDAETGRVLDAFDVSGAGRFGGVRYTQELARRGRLSHRLAAGIDDRHFDNDVVFAGVDFGQDVRSRPLSLHYAAEYAGDDRGLDFRLQYARNLESGGDNGDSAYARNRAGAEAGWDALRGGATFSSSLPARWAVRGAFEAQYADEALIPGEQFGLGGIDSVRGFSEREISGDDGLRASLELWPPALPGGAGLRFLVFTDVGRVRFTGAPPSGSPRNDTIASIGAGARWHWKEHVALQLDVGVVVEGTATREHGARGHLNVLVRY